MRKSENDAPEHPNHRSGPIVSRRALYRIALYGRFARRNQASKSQFSDELLVLLCY